MYIKLIMLPFGQFDFFERKSLKEKWTRPLTVDLVAYIKKHHNLDVLKWVREEGIK